jgi:hypothetical protein
MVLIYAAMPHALTSRGWMVFNRRRLQPVAGAMTVHQAHTLAALLNLVATAR